jgi:NAD-dependent SIR2 family protein deacetylase
VRDGIEEHFDEIAWRFARGRIVPFLGAGASLCDRGTEKWRPGCGFLPSGAELAAHLAEQGRHPVRDSLNLMEVAQWIAWTEGEDGLYERLRQVFDQDFEPTSLHRLLARWAKALDERRCRQLLVATMNYDDLVERAFADERLAFDVVWYEAKPVDERGKFVHQPPGGPPQLITRPNKYVYEFLSERPTLLKLHGSIDRTDATNDSYVITEDDYIDYLDRGSLTERLPLPVMDRLASSSLLFLGYSLSADWDMRATMKRWSLLRTTFSWSVLRLSSDPGRRKVEQRLWESLDDVRLVPFELRDYAEALSAREPEEAIEAALERRERRSP